MASRGPTFRFDPARPACDELRRVAAEVLDDAASNLRSDGSSVRAARSLDDARSLLRLARSALDRPTRRTAIRRVRAAQRTLDADAIAPPLTTVFDRAAGSAAASITSGALERLRDSLAQEEAAVAAARAVAARGSLGDHARPPQAVAADDLDAAVLAASLWHVRDDGFELFASGLAREYRRGRAAFGAAADARSADSTRAMAQRVRDHQRHLRLLRSAWPPVMKAIVREARTLAELSEHQHDLARLRGALLSRRSGQLRRDASAFVGVLDADRDDLALNIAALGERVFAEDPDQLVERIEAWWNAAERRVPALVWPLPGAEPPRPIPTPPEPELPRRPLSGLGGFARPAAGPAAEHPDRPTERRGDD